MSTVRESSRRVGVWAARKRARPARMSTPSSEPGRPRVELADGGLEHLVPVELGVFPQRSVGRGGDEARSGSPPPRRKPAAIAPARSTPPWICQHSSSSATSPLVSSGRRAAGTFRKRSR